MKNRALLFSVFFVVAILLTGCGKEPQMDVLDGGAYHYKSAPYSFKVDLPEEFIYYQVQTRIGKDEKNVQTSDWHDVEFYVPTSDQVFAQEIPAYGKVFTVRVFEAGKFKNTEGFEKLIDGTDRTWNS